MALTTTANVKEYLGITSTDEDDLIDRLVLAAQAAIESYCGRKLDQGTYTEYFDGNNARSVVLTNTPIDSVASVSYRKDNDEWTAYDATVYDFDADSGIVELLYASEAWWLAGYDGCPGGFPKGLKSVRVVYDGGYATIPTDLEQAAIDLVAMMRGGSAEQRAARASGLQSESLGYQSRSWFQMGEDSREIWMMSNVGRYRRVAI